MASLLLHTLNLSGTIVAYGLIAAAVIIYAAVWWLERAAYYLNQGWIA